MWCDDVQFELVKTILTILIAIVRSDRPLYLYEWQQRGDCHNYSAAESYDKLEDLHLIS